MTADRRCESCEKPIPDRPHQAPTVRACGPSCARRIFDREHPGFAHWGSRFGAQSWEPS